MEKKRTLAIPLGDSAGIGPELVAKTAINGFLEEQCNPLIMGDERVFKKALALVGGRVSYKKVTSGEEISFEQGICFYEMADVDPDDIKIGEVSKICGQSSVKMIDTCIELWRQGFIDGVCFGPFNKAAIKLVVGEHFNSELAYMKEKLGYDGPAGEINHMNHIFTTRAVSHVPMAELVEKLTIERVKNAIYLLYTTMRNAGYKNPRIGVAALNPHGGEYGTCGTEEITVIRPAIEEMNEQGMITEGPYSADTIFNRAFNHKEFDGIVTMYHDQGQIALKLMGFEYGVSIEGGLPMPFTTPSHGTAFDIAGKGVAKTTAFERAVLDAVALAVNS